MAFIVPEVGNHADQHMPGRNTQLDTNILLGWRRRKLLHVQADRKRRHTIRRETVSMNQVLPIALAAGDDHHVEQAAVQQVRGGIVIERR